jgi:hypothetical protein
MKQKSIQFNNTQTDEKNKRKKKKYRDGRKGRGII